MEDDIPADELPQHYSLQDEYVWFSWKMDVWDGVGGTYRGAWTYFDVLTGVN